MDLIKETGSIVANANTYVTRAEADTFFQGQSDAAAWTGASTATKDAALANAAFILDRQFRWRGVRTSPESQAMQWPRAGVAEVDREIPSTEIPRAVRDAQCLIARGLISSGGSFLTGEQSGGMAGLKLGQGALEITYATQATKSKADDKTVVNAEIRALLEPLGKFAQGSGIVKVRRG